MSKPPTPTKHRTHGEFAATGDRKVPMPHVMPTELGRMIVSRLRQLCICQSDLSRRLVDESGREKPWVRGDAGRVTMVLKGARPIPEATVDHWLAALEWPVDSAPARAFRTALLEHRSYTLTGGRGGSGEALIRRCRHLEAENRILRARLATYERR